MADRPQKGAPIRTLKSLALGAVVVAAVVAAWQHHTELVALSRWLGAQGAWGVVAFIVVVALVGPTMFPDSVFAVVAGAVYGLVEGTLIVTTGAILGSILSYALGRTLLRSHIASLVGRSPRLSVLEGALRTQGVGAVLPIRLLPLNPSFIAYLLAGSGVRWRPFLLASPALVPGHFIGVYVGYASARAGSGHAETFMGHVLTWGGLGLALVATMLVVRLVMRTLEQSSRERTEPGPESAGS